MTSPSERYSAPGYLRPLHEGDQIAAEAGARLIQPGSWRPVETILDELCTTGRIPRPNLWVLDVDEPNAMATGTRPDQAAITLNAGLVDQLDRHELRGVLAHEVGHIVTGDVAQTTEIVRQAMQGIAIANVGAFVFDLFADSLLVSIGGWLLAGAYSSRKVRDIAEFQRMREFAADRFAMVAAGSPYGLQSALVKMERRMLHAEIPEWLRFATIVEPPHPEATHPPTVERVSAIEPSISARTHRAVCSHCAYQESIDATYCRRCGTALPRLTCHGCEAGMAITDRFCRLCGTRRRTVYPRGTP